MSSSIFIVIVLLVFILFIPISALYMTNKNISGAHLTEALFKKPNYILRPNVQAIISCIVTKNGI